MCLAIPAEVLSVSDDMLHCRVGESSTFLDVSAMLLPEPAKVGDYVIVHAGFALRVLNSAEAGESLRILREMAEADGRDVIF